MKKTKPVEVLDLKPNRFVYEVQERLYIYDVSIQINAEQVEELFNRVLEIESEETKEITRGDLWVKRDKTGTYSSVKNIGFKLSDVFDFVSSLTQIKGTGRLIVAAVFLWKLMERLKVDLKEKPTMVCVALYRATQHSVITDENVIEYIGRELKESPYGEMTEKETEDNLSELLDMGIVLIEQGRYEVAEKLHFE